MNRESWDTKVRQAAFRWLDELARAGDDILRRDVLQAGFGLEGQQIHMMSPQGIFTPSGCRYPLSITTVMNGVEPVIRSFYSERVALWPNGAEHFGRFHQIQPVGRI